MLTDYQWVKLLDSERAVRSFLQGTSESPVGLESHSGRGYRLYQITAAFRPLYLGEFEAAGKILSQLDEQAQKMLCYELAAFWYEAETEDPRRCWQKLGQWIVRRQNESANDRINRLFRPVAALDRRLALRWAPALRYYLATLFVDWSPEILDAMTQDRQIALSRGADPLILVRIDYLMQLARGRQQKSVPQIIETARSWQELCRRNPEYGSGNEFLLEAAVALEYDERFKEALEWLEQGLQDEPDQYELLAVKARILKRIGDAGGSLAVCDRLILLMPDDYTGYCLRSNTFFILGRYDKAMSDARKACEIAPDNPNSYMARAFVQMQLEHYEEALQDFEMTLKYDPRRYDALRGQGKCLSMLGRDYEALASFNALRREYPEDPDLYYELADVLFSAGYLDDCQEVCRKCLELDPAYVSAYVILGMVALRKNNDEKAHHLLNKAVDLEPDNPFALNELSYMVHLDGDDDRALELVDRALAESPEYADALCNKGVILYFRSEFDEAATLFDQTIKVAPDHVAAWVGKGNTLTQLCEFDDALRSFDQA
ncbi:MAG TPA: hypothetical protein DD640_00110, partial [Clostridiales bacterium]|nr:hypothetical protein [Clostridiales bacterium]